MKKVILTLTALFVCSAVAFAGDSTEYKHKMDSTMHKTKHKMEMKKDTTEHKMKMDTTEHKMKMDTTEHKMKMDTTEHKMKMKAPKIITTKSGLQYFDTKIGDGAEAKKGSQIEVHYTGWLYIDGKKGNKFDSSVDRGTPIAFRLGAGRMIRGWDEGLVGVKVGGKRTLIIPPDLGYGKAGRPPVIPANTYMIFECEMMSVK